MICIGGPHNGEQVKENGDYLRFPIPFRATIGERFGLNIHPRDVKSSITYSKRAFKIAGQVVHFYIVEGMTEEEAYKQIEAVFSIVRAP